jgi:hypothetical protein
MLCGRRRLPHEDMPEFEPEQHAAAKSPSNGDGVQQRSPVQGRRAGWLRRRLQALPDALRFLTTGRDGLAGRDTAQIEALITWIVPLGLIIGLAWAGVFRLTWRLYGEVNGLRLIPALAVVLLDVLLTARFMLLAPAMLVRARPDSPYMNESGDPAGDRLDSEWPLRATMVAALTLLTQWTLIVSIPQASPWWPAPDDWRSWFNWLYPAPIYRPLILAPLWGRWAILLSSCIGKTAPNVDRSTEALCARMTPGRVLVSGLLPLTLSCIYFSREKNFLVGGLIALVVVAASYASAVTLARYRGGQSRATIFATGQIAQIIFLAVNRALWPQIHP